MLYQYVKRTRNFFGNFYSSRKIVFFFYFIPPTRVGYEMIMAIWAQRASLAIYHLLFNLRSWIDILKYTMRGLTRGPNDLFE